MVGDAPVTVMPHSLTVFGFIRLWLARRDKLEKLKDVLPRLLSGKFDKAYQEELLKDFNQDCI